MRHYTIQPLGEKVLLATASIAGTGPVEELLREYEDRFERRPFDGQ
jgi:hypothetical protein